MPNEDSPLTVAAEKGLTTVAAEDAGDAADLAEWLLLRIRMHEEIFYPASWLIRNDLRLRWGSRSDGAVTAMGNR